jgi:hypothetical protein
VIAVGIVLMVLGLVAIGFGIAGGIAKMIRDLRGPAATKGLDPFEGLENFLKALTEFLKTLIQAPGWLALVVVGFALVVFGAWLTGAA